MQFLEIVKIMTKIFIFILFGYFTTVMSVTRLTPKDITEFKTFCTKSCKLTSDCYNEMPHRSNIYNKLCSSLRSTCMHCEYDKVMQFKNCSSPAQETMSASATKTYNDVCAKVCETSKTCSVEKKAHHSTDRMCKEFNYSCILCTDAYNTNFTYCLDTDPPKSTMTQTTPIPKTTTPIPEPETTTPIPEPETTTPIPETTTPIPEPETTTPSPEAEPETPEPETTTLPPTTTKGPEKPTKKIPVITTTPPNATIFFKKRQNTPTATEIDDPFDNKEEGDNIVL